MHMIFKFLRYCSSENFILTCCMTYLNNNCINNDKNLHLHMILVIFFLKLLSMEFFHGLISLLIYLTDAHLEMLFYFKVGLFVFFKKIRRQVHC